MRGSPTSLTASRICAAMRTQPCIRSGLSWPILESRTLVTNGEYTSARVLFVLLMFMGYLATASADNLAKCGERLKEIQDAAWKATNSTSPAPELRLSYGQCVAECGGGIGDVNLEAFSQSFGAWFLPWIALMFQIPFGAECKRYIRVSSPFGALTRCFQTRSKMF